MQNHETINYCIMEMMESYFVILDTLVKENIKEQDTY